MHSILKCIFLTTLTKPNKNQSESKETGKFQLNVSYFSKDVVPIILF